MFVVAGLSPTLIRPMDCGPSGSSVRGISQARILEWVAISFYGAGGVGKENEQAAERAGDKKSTLSRALKGLPERGHMHLKKNTPVGLPPAGPSPPSPSLQLMLYKGVPKPGRARPAPGRQQNESRGKGLRGTGSLQGNSLHPSPLSSHGTLEARELGVSLETTGPAPLLYRWKHLGPRLGNAQQLDLRCQAAWIPRSPTFWSHSGVTAT